MGKTTLASLSREITTEAEAYAYLENLRWKGAPTCAHCGDSDVYLIAPKNGTSRRTRTGAQSERRVWKCRRCGKQFSVLTGTIMHGTKVPIRTWVLVYFDFMSAKNGMSAREVERKYGVCPRTAWFLLHRIREAMQWHWSDGRLHGIVMADETYIGGDPKNRHKNDPRNSRDGRGTEKIPVVSIISEATGEVRSHVVANVTGHTLGTIIAGNVDWDGSTLVTDSWKGYGPIGQSFSKHVQLDHSAGQYASGGYSTNRVEGFFSQLCRSIDGTHHRVSVEHLHRYVAEFDFRYSTCKASDPERMGKLLGQIDGRVTYKRITDTQPVR